MKCNNNLKSSWHELNRLLSGKHVCWKNPKMLKYNTENIKSKSSTIWSSAIFFCVNLPSSGHANFPSNECAFIVITLQTKYALRYFLFLFYKTVTSFAPGPLRVFKCMFEKPASYTFDCRWQSATKIIYNCIFMYISVISLLVVIASKMIFG